MDPVGGDPAGSHVRRRPAGPGAAVPRAPRGRRGAHARPHARRPDGDPSARDARAAGGRPGQRRRHRPVRVRRGALRRLLAGGRAGRAALQPADAQPALAHGRLPGVHAFHRRGEPVHRQRRRVVPRLVPHRWRVDHRMGPRPGRSRRGRADAAAGRVMRHRRGHHRAGGRPPAGPRPGLPRAAVLDAQELRGHRALLRGPRRLREPAVDAVATLAGPCRLRALYRRHALHPVAPGHRRARGLGRRRRAPHRRDPAPLQAARPRRRRRRSRSWRRWSATRSTPGTSSTRCSSGSTGSRTPSTSG